MPSNNVYIEIPKSHLIRLKNYISDIWKIDCTISNDYILIKDVDLSSLLKRIYNDEIKLWRYITRIYPYNSETKNYEEILTLQFQDKIFRVVGHPKEIEDKLLDDLDDKYELNPKTFTHYLSTIFLAQNYFYGLYPSHLYYKRPVDSFDPISRAYYKIYESISIFNISIKKDWKVLDIGSSPGGWVQYFRNRVNSIIAVDPAELKLKDLSGIVHLQKKVEESLEEIKKYGKYNILTCDMNQDPREIAQTINSLSQFMKSDAILILTLKMIFKNKQNQESLVNDTVQILSKEIKNMKVKRLFANSKYEKQLFGVFL
ncbi:MAG: hypothetical protein GF364_13585 [Candidatus Lokiarchaeota archaeon]|nr:hypothetical protein [Candidatus Lokiarchaeota archaeon]